MPEAGPRAAKSKEPRDAAPVPTPRRRLLPRSFYLHAPEIVARGLLGKVLVKRTAGGARGGDLAGRIVEVEAYFGGEDPAAHAFNGKTARNAVIFGPPGHAYVYFIYGMHFCLNVTCEPEGRAGCILIRALEPLAGLEAMAKRRWPGGRVGLRNPAEVARALTSGPGRLCQAFGITRERDNGADFASPRSTLQIQEDGFLAGQVLVTPRIGIRKAADRPARFLLAGNRYVSKVPGRILA